MFEILKAIFMNCIKQFSVTVTLTARETWGIVLLKSTTSACIEVVEEANCSAIWKFMTGYEILAVQKYCPKAILLLELYGCAVIYNGSISHVFICIYSYPPPPPKANRASPAVARVPAPY